MSNENKKKISKKYFVLSKSFRIFVKQYSTQAKTGSNLDSVSSQESISSHRLKEVQNLNYPLIKRVITYSIPNRRKVLAAMLKAVQDRNYPREFNFHRRVS